MFQKSSVNPISAAAEVVDVWQGPAARGWLDAAKKALALPKTSHSFTFFLLGLLLIAAATTMQVYLSAQILESEVELGGMRAELDSVERVNAEIAWQISVVSQLDNIAARARALGFQPVVEETYVARTGSTGAAEGVAPPLPFYGEQPAQASAGTTEQRAEGWLSATAADMQLGAGRIQAQIAGAVEEGSMRVQGWFPQAWRTEGSQLAE